MTGVFHVRIGDGPTITIAPRGYTYQPRRGWAVVDTCTGGDPRSVYITTAPLRWHPAYWLWRWRQGRQGWAR